MVIKTFKFSNKDTKYNYNTDEGETTLSPANVREVLVNKFISLIKEKVNELLSISYDDSNIEIKITTENSSIQYDIIFSGIDSLPVISPSEFKVNTEPTPGPGPDPESDPDPEPDPPTPSTVAITGRVVSPSSATVPINFIGIENVEVVLVRDNGEEDSGYTDEDGYYSITANDFTGGYLTFNTENCPEYESVGTDLAGNRIRCSSTHTEIDTIYLNPSQEFPTGSAGDRKILGGYVVDSVTYEPLAGVIVVLTQYGGGSSTTIAALTDISGFFYFTETDVRNTAPYVIGSTNYRGSFTITHLRYQSKVVTYNIGGGECWWTPYCDGVIELEEDEVEERLTAITLHTNMILNTGKVYILGHQNTTEYNFDGDNEVLIPNSDEIEEGNIIIVDYTNKEYLPMNIPFSASNRNISVTITSTPTRLDFGDDVNVDTVFGYVFDNYTKLPINDVVIGEDNEQSGGIITYTTADGLFLEEAGDIQSDTFSISKNGYSSISEIDGEVFYNALRAPIFFLDSV